MNQILIPAFFKNILALLHTKKPNPMEYFCFIPIKDII